jgi:serine/threonine protein phosphatase PrpC
MGYLEKKIGFFSEPDSFNKKKDVVRCFTNPKSEVAMMVGIAKTFGAPTREEDEAASEYLIAELDKYFRNQEYRNLAARLHASPKNIPFMYKMVLEEINEHLFNEQQKTPQLKNRSTLYTGVLAYEMELYLAHVGNCRVYRVRSGRIRCLTDDHSLGARIRKEKGKDAGDIPEEYYSILYRAFGYRPWIKMDFQVIQTLANDYYLFCTDEVYHHVTELEMDKILLQCEYDPEKCSRVLVERAREKGATGALSAAGILYINYMGLEMSKSEATIRLEF